MNKLDKKYQHLLKDILENGWVKEDRTGTGTISIFGTQLKHTMSEGFPLLTTKKVYWKGIVYELLWFLSGNTNIKYLVDNDVNIWVGDAYKVYSKWAENNEPINNVTSDYYHLNEDGTYRILLVDEFINKIKTDDSFAEYWGELGPIYSSQWRKWKTLHYYETITFTEAEVNSFKSKIYIDQISNLIETLKVNPDDRRMLVSAWNPAELENMVLPPCHYSFQVYTRELTDFELEEQLDKWVNDIENDRIIYGHNWKNYLIEQTEHFKLPRRTISLLWNQRSVDSFLGLSFNIASYGLLLSMIGKVVNMVPEDLIFNGGDTHLYLNHIEQAKEQISKEPYRLPTLKFKDKVYNSIDDFTFDDIILEDYKSHKVIKAPLSN